MDKPRVYTTPSCVYCHSLLAYLREKGILFEHIDASEDPQKWGEFLLDKTGQMAVPVFELGGEFVVGFDRERIESLLKEHGFLKD